MDNKITMEQFVQNTEIELHTCIHVNENPDMNNSGDMDNWFCVLYYVDDSDPLNLKDKAMPIYYSLGIGHNGREPTIYDILESIRMDAQCIEDRTFEGFAFELGYDIDSRAAYEIYQNIQKQTSEFMELVGPGNFDTFMYGIDDE